MESVRMSLCSSEKSGNVRVFSNGNVQEWGGNDKFGIVRTLDPIPSETDSYYFQVEINHSGDDHCNIHIGLTSKDLSRHTKTIENWSNKTFSGFTNVFHSFGYSSSGTVYGEKTTHNSRKHSYSWEDTIGCHVDNINGICCFSKNGIYLPKLFHLTDMGEQLFPTIAFGLTVTEANIETLILEKPFQFDMQGMQCRLSYEKHFFHSYAKQCWG